MNGVTAAAVVVEQPEILMNAKTTRRKTKVQAAANVATSAKPTATTKKPARAAAVAAPKGNRAEGVQSKVSPRGPTPRPNRVAPGAPAVPAGASKQALLIALLQAEPGATMDQMMTLTAWQAHTVRGTISGVLRKKLGLNVTCHAASDSGDRVYRIVS